MKLAEYQKGYKDPTTGEWVQGADYETAASMARLDAQLAAGAEEGKANLAYKAKMQENYNTMLNGILTGAIGKDWDQERVNESYN